MPLIDVIIPVYRGFFETRRCIESVLASTCNTPHRVVVIDDASPEPEIASWLDELVAVDRVELLRNARNEGFVFSVNRAMELHPDRDAVLLNSDTEVGDGWLDRLAECASRREDAASVCPFSNNATLASYPRIGESNPLPTQMTTAKLGRIAAAANKSLDCEIPTSVGFCMYVRRAAWAKVGAFDQVAFGKGYGEENDWCSRASSAGWKHYLACDAFVFHEGGVSFGSNAEAAKLRAQAIIQERNPTYDEQIRQFFEDDPLRPYRRRMDLERIRGSELPNLLFITHQWGGGTEQHLQDLAALLEGHCHVFVMKPHGGHSFEIRWTTGKVNSEEFCVHFNWVSDRDSVVDFLRDLGVARVHIHHVHGHAPEVLDLARMLGVPLDVTLHDYFPLTPQYHLDPGAVLPERIVSHWGWTTAEWRHRMRTFLAGADRVMAPSVDLAKRVHTHFPELNIKVMPHPDVLETQRVQPAKVLVIGGVTLDKGLGVVVKCAEHAQAQGLPLHFEILGHTEHPIRQFPDLPVTVTGSYPQAEIDRLISLSRADVAMFPAQIPESFSFTLSAALRAKLPIVASRIGSFPERLAGHPQNAMVEWDAPAQAWNEAAMRLAGTRPPLPGADTGANASYVEEYLHPVKGKPTSITAPNAPEFRYFAPKELPKEAELTLEHLYRGGVSCGHRPARLELEKRIAKFDLQLRNALDSAAVAHEYAHQAGERETANAERFRVAYEQQEQNAHAWRQEYEKVVSSKSWKVTAPLRSAVQRVKEFRIAAGLLRRRALLLPMQAAMAYRILRTQGAGALVARLKLKFARLTELPDPPTREFSVEADFLPLSVPSSESPIWSILIPVFGKHALTYNCLRSIAETCSGMQIEVVVADDASPEPASEALSMVSGIRFVRHPENLGFLKSCNQTAAQLRGKYIVLLNNDTIVTGKWLSELAVVFDEDADAGLVGVKLLFPDGKLQEAGGIVWRDGSASNYGRGLDPRRPEFNYRREVDYCSGACVMLPASLWQELGGFDLRYFPAYYEDTDLAFRVREAGYKVVYQPHAVVVHFEGQTSGTDLTQGIKRHQVTNQHVFEERWRRTLATHRTHGIAPQRERDRKATRRVLVYDVCIPRPDRDSGSLRMFEMLKAMRALGCRVSFVPDNGYLPESYLRNLQSLGVEVLHAPFVDPLSNAIVKQSGEFEVVILSRASVASKYAALLREHMPHAKFVYDTVDLHFLRMQREAEVSGNAFDAAAAVQMKATELALMAQADATLVVSSFERALLEKEAPRARVHVLSNIHEPDPGPATFKDRAGVVFIGGFLHPPNVDAVKWYATEVLPILRQKCPGLITTVIGGDAPEQLIKLASTDLVFAGYVPDVKPVFNSARIAISPLRYGAGVKGKVNLAMQYGVPVVATPCSIEGMHLQDRESVFVAAEAHSFAEAILALNGDEHLWQSLRDGGLENIRKHFSPIQAKAVLQEILDL